MPKPPAQSKAKIKWGQRRRLYISTTEGPKMAGGM